MNRTGIFKAMKLCRDYAKMDASQRQTLQTQRLQEIVRYAKMRGCSAITLNVWCCNEGAMAFYEKLGMKPQKIGMEVLLNEE